MFQQKKQLRIHNSLSKKSSWIESMVVETIFKTNLDTDPITCGVVQNSMLTSWTSSALESIFNKHRKVEMSLSRILTEKLLCTSRGACVSLYCQSLIETFPCHPIMFVVALFYLQKVMQMSPKVHYVKFKVYFAVCLTLATKMFEDNFYSNIVYHEYSLLDDDVSFKQFNHYEKKLLRMMNYEMYISYADLKLFISNFNKNEDCL
jgi:hypothetical protein